MPYGKVLREDHGGRQRGQKEASTIMSDLFLGLAGGRALLVVFLSLAWHAVSPQYRRARQYVFDRSERG